MDWQPIETAPQSTSDARKDRIEVLVAYPLPDGEATVFIAYKDELGWDTGFWRLHRTPIAWMPLPDPPKPSAPAEPTPDRSET